MALPQHIGVVHDWLVGMRGGERVLDAICELYPGARLHVLVHRKGSCSPRIEALPITTSFLQHLPLGVSHYRYYLPLFPEAFGGLDLRQFDLVISSSSAGAKAARVKPGGLHLCYCHTPMRYIWDQYDQYFAKGRAPLAVRAAMQAVRPRLQRWDVASSAQVSRFAANSLYVAERIGRLYNRDAEVIYPPVDVGRFAVSAEHDGSYLMMGALVPYKRADLAIEAFNRLGRRLVVIGAGSDERRLRALAGKTISFLTNATDAEVRDSYGRCRAVVMPGEEDFGIVPVEAMACGKPVIAYGRGGVTESVRDGVDGMHFAEQTVPSLAAAVEMFERRSFDSAGIRSRAMGFGKEAFLKKFSAFVERAWEERH